MEVNLATLIDNINYKDVYRIIIEGTQFDKLKFIIEESDLRSDVVNYPQIPNNWYRRPIK